MKTPQTKSETLPTRQAVNNDLVRYRKKHFKAEVKPTDHPLEEGEITLSVTMNGYQWNSLSFLKSEVTVVIEALRLSQQSAT
jgi:hypothetical protein